MPSARVLADQASIIQDLDVTGVGQLGGLASELAKQTAIKATSQQESVLSDAQKLGIGRLYGAPPL
jgi:hypothetical protein